MIGNARRPCHSFETRLIITHAGNQIDHIASVGTQTRQC